MAPVVLTAARLTGVVISRSIALGLVVYALRRSMDGDDRRGWEEKAQPRPATPRAKRWVRWG